MVKGNAYGHGLLISAQAFMDAGFKELGVADLNEATALRQVRITQSGCLPERGAGIAIHGLYPAGSSLGCWKGSGLAVDGACKCSFSEGMSVNSLCTNLRAI